LSRRVGEHSTHGGIDLPRTVLARLPNADGLPLRRMPMRIQNVLPKTGSTIVLNILLKNRVLETLTVESELLLITPHVERDRVIPSRVHNHALPEVLRPLIHVRFKPANIRAHRDNVVHRENVADHGV